MVIEDLLARVQAVEKPNGCPRTNRRGPHTSIVIVGPGEPKSREQEAIQGEHPAEALVPKRVLVLDHAANDGRVLRCVHEHQFSILRTSSLSAAAPRTRQ